MSESEQSGAGRREVAYRLFASEFDDADFSHSESDEERAPNYVITPTGARVNRLFVVGVLTEVEEVSEDVLRARVVDPTGAFVLYAGQYQPDEQAFLDSARTPMFVAVTGKARTFQPDDSEQVFTSIRPESLSEVDAATRDRWTVQTAEQTIERVGHMATALSLDVRGDDLRATLEDHGVDDGLAAGIPLAIEHYGTTGAYLTALRDLAVDTTRLVADELDEVEPLSLAPDTDGEGDLSALADAEVDVSTAVTATADATSSATETPVETEDTETEATATETAETGTTDVTADAETTSTAETPSTASTTDKTTDTAIAATTDVAETETEPVEAAAATGTGTGTVSESPTDETEQTTAETEPTTTEETDSTAPTETLETAETDSDDDDIGDFEPGEFELDEDEREEIEEEFGTEFQSGTDVPEPGESDIETPDPEELAEETQADDTVDETPVEEPAEPSTETDSESEAAPTEPESEPASAEESDETPEPVEDVDLEDAAVETMEELDEGDGADRETLVETLADRYGVSADEAEDAIQDALMGGRCYEPDDSTVKPI